MKHLRFLDHVPFVILMGATAGIFSGAGVLFVNGNPSVAAMIGTFCAIIGFFGGAFVLRQLGLKGLATMGQVIEADDK